MAKLHDGSSSVQEAADSQDSADSGKPAVRSPKQGQEAGRSGSGSAAKTADEQQAARVALAEQTMQLDRIEDTPDGIVPKGVITSAPKITASAISKEEREAKLRARRESAQSAQRQSKVPRTRIGRWWNKLQSGPDRIKFGMCIVAMGVVYGDIGTSPLYTAQNFISGQGGSVRYVDRFAVLGLLSLLFWTITLITTVKYVLIAMRIDNKGEGGIFALYSLVRKYGRWLAIPAMVGGAAFLADSVLTPAVSISSAVEGLRTIPSLTSTFEDNPQISLIVTAIIILVLFSIQSRGTEKIGHTFGSIVVVWFVFIAVMGLINCTRDWSVFEALNPVWGLRFLFSGDNRAGIALMGTVFLSTTGAEALYSDMGHVGRGSIYATWPFIFISLVFCYFGQGAWMLSNSHNPAVIRMGTVNPFFQMMPGAGWRTVAVIMSVTAGVIASQALITGAFTMVSEATSLNWMPHLQVRYPAHTRGQLYIPAINTVLCLATLTVLFMFRDSEHISAAYGLALTITMITTTILLGAYIWRARRHYVGAVVFMVVFLAIQIMFLVASLYKFMRGGWFTMLLTLLILMVMYVWDVGTRVERSQRRHLSPQEFLPALDMLHRDVKVPMYADNVVYLTSDPDMRRLDTDIFYSIFGGHPKRARAWWAVSVDVTDDPYTREYSVEDFGTNYLFRVRIRLGFKVSQNVATYLHQIMHDLIDSGDLPEQRTIYPKLDEDQQIGTIQYVLIHKDLIPESRIDRSGATALRIKYAIRRVCGSPIKWFGLTAYNPVTETQPLFVAVQPVAPLKPVALRKVKKPVTLQSVLARQEERRAAKERQVSEGQAIEAARQVARELQSEHDAKVAKAAKVSKTAKAATDKAAVAAKVTKASVPSKASASPKRTKAAASTAKPAKAARSHAAKSEKTSTEEMDTEKSGKSGK